MPEGLDSQVRESAGDGESFSATVVRLVEDGLAEQRRPRPAWIGSGDSGDPLLAERVEEVLRELAIEADPND